MSVGATSGNLVTNGVVGSFQAAGTVASSLDSAFRITVLAVALFMTVIATLAVGLTTLSFFPTAMTFAICLGVTGFAYWSLRK